MIITVQVISSLLGEAGEPSAYRSVLIPPLGAALLYNISILSVLESIESDLLANI